MGQIDYIVLAIYLAGVFGVGVLFATKNKSSADMFAAGGQSPWWTSGLSAFMTMFSANTFVVWGGIAYRQGMVAVMINLMYGVAALITGYVVAGKWKKLSVKTPAEFIQLRFGNAALHFFTWFMTVFKMITTAGALYALGRILVAMMPIPENSVFVFLRDAETGNVSLAWAIIVLSSIVVIYTMIGGLWAVLMTDVLQFIVLNLAVLFVIPLALLKIGGVGAFFQGAAEAPAVFMHGDEVIHDGAGRSMLSLISGDYTLMFLAGWCAIHFFMIGAEWAFVQRFICVPDAKAARKSTYLFGALYLISPILWLLPPMIWRVQTPIPEGADEATVLDLAEKAYILSCQSVLPAGMIGLMVAAMFSATASMVSSQLNVFSGVFTRDLFKSWAPFTSRENDPDGQRGELFMGRFFTVVLGIVLILIALSYRAMGGAERVIVDITQIVVVALLAPTIWGLFSRSITSVAVWLTAGISVLVGLTVKFGFSTDGLFVNWEAVRPLSQWIQTHESNVGTFTGVVLPVLILLVVQLCSRGTAAGYRKVAQLQEAEITKETTQNVQSSNLPAIVVGWSIACCGLLLFGLIPFNDLTPQITALVVFGLILLLVSAVILWQAYRSHETPTTFNES